ncbi:hypothetical protein ACP70R_042030 [Stipagrostis hirtigluma subsp. patula]
MAHGHDSGGAPEDIYIVTIGSPENQPHGCRCRGTYLLAVEKLMVV